MTSPARLRVELRPATGAPGSHRALPDLPAICVTRPGRLTVDLPRLGELDLGGCAVLVRTDWAEGSGVPAPWLTPASAKALVDAGVSLLGIDGPHVDDPDDRPVVATCLAEAGVLVLVGLGGLDEVPRHDFRVSVDDDGTVHASVRLGGPEIPSD